MRRALARALARENDFVRHTRGGATLSPGYVEEGLQPSVNCVEATRATAPTGATDVSPGRKPRELRNSPEPAHDARNSLGRGD